MSTSKKGGLEPFIPSRWDIFKSNPVDLSTAKRNKTLVFPLEFRNSNVWGSTSTVTFLSDMADQFAFYSDSYLQFQVQLTSTQSTLTAFPAGTAVALAPDFAATFIDQLQFMWGTEIIENPTAFVHRSTLLADIIDYTYDNRKSRKGLTDVFILDAVGQTQSTAGQPGLAPFVTTGGFSTQAGAPVTISIAANGTSLVATSTTTGAFITSGTVIECNTGIAFETNNAGAISANTLAVSGAAGVLVAGSVGPSFAGVTFNPVGGLFYDQSGNQLSVTCANGGTALTVVAQVLGNRTVFNNLSGVIVSSQNNASGFWQRQALTDNGRVLTLKIPLKRFCRFAKFWEDALTGERATLKLYVSGQTQQRMIQAAPGVGTGYVWVTDLQWVVPVEEPSHYIKPQLMELLKGPSRIEFQWDYMDTQQLSTMSSNNYYQTFSLPNFKANFVVVSFTPTAYNGTQLQNYMMSTVTNKYPGATTDPNNGTGAVVSKAFLNYGGNSYPQLPYGNYPSDNGRIIEAFEDLLGKSGVDMFAPSIDMMEFFQNYFFLVFDLRGRVDDKTGDSANVQLTIQLPGVSIWTSALSPNTLDVYVTTIGRRHAEFTAKDGRMMYKELANAP